MLVIGFATQFYTLWEKNEYTRSEGCKITEYRFIKNVSTDVDKVKALYPDVEIDMGLKGSHSFVVYEKKEFVKVPNDCFQFGKYKGEKIDDSCGSDYLAWYYQSAYDETEDGLANAECVRAVLEPRGYSFDGKFCYDPESTKYRAERKKAIAEAKERVKSGNVDFIAEKNLNYEGYIIADYIGYEFENFKVLYYAGYEYGLPTLNGKGKKIKGKKVVVTDYEVLDELTIKVKDFRVEAAA